MKKHELINRFKKVLFVSCDMKFAQTRDLNTKIPTGMNPMHDTRFYVSNLMISRRSGYILYLGLPD